MDCNKVSHMYINVNSVISDNIEENFGKLSCTTGKKHTLLGVDIKFIGGKKVAVSTAHHVDEAIEYFGETPKGNMVKPTISQLFILTSEAKYLDYLKKERYNLIMAKILWIMNRSQPELEKVVYFICTRLQFPTKEY